MIEYLPMKYSLNNSFIVNNKVVPLFHIKKYHEELCADFKKLSQK